MDPDLAAVLAVTGNVIVNQLVAVLVEGLGQEVEVLEMNGVFDHNPEKIRVYKQPSSGWYYLYFVDRSYRPAIINLRTRVRSRRPYVGEGVGLSTNLEYVNASKDWESGKVEVKMEPPQQLSLAPGYFCLEALDHSSDSVTFQDGVLTIP